MAASLRNLCTALGVQGRVSVCQDILGFEAAHLPARIDFTRPLPEIRLNRYVQLLRGPHFHLRLIVAGSDLLTANDQDVMDYAIFRIRDIYSAASIGIGRVTRDRRTAANSAGHARVTTSNDIDASGTDLTADGDFVPVVVPADMNVTTMNPDGTVTRTLGKSPTPGPCSPRNGPGMRSTVVDIAGEGMGRTLAHEVGHYLGAEHPPGAPGNNLMAQTGAVANPFTAIDILPADRTTMLNHCTMRPAQQV